MRMRGMAGMFIIIVVLLGMIAWVFQNNVREANLVSTEAARHEVRSNRLAVLRNVIEKSYSKVEPKNRAAWAAALQHKLGPMYEVEIMVVKTSEPPYAVLEDRTHGLTAWFYLPSSRS